MLVDDLQVDRERLAELCERYGVARLEVLGSFSRGDAEAGSDLDILVTYRPEVHGGLEFVALQRELEELVGRSVDLLTRSSVERSTNKYFRGFALRQTEPIHQRG